MVILIKQYNPAIVFATLTIAFFGSYACITLYEQYRLCSKENKPKLMHPTAMLVLMAMCIGGIAIWCMHFVAMSGVTFIHPDTRETIHIRYRLDYTLISLATVLIFSFVGLFISSRDRNFVLDQNDVVSNYIDDVRKKSIAEMRSSFKSKKMVLVQSLFRNLVPIIIGGVIIAGGVCVMHYLGMKAMVFDGQIQWDIGIITSSVLIALVAATAALWILFRLLAVFPHIELLRFASAIIAAAAVNGMHYTGMTAGDFEYVENKHMVDTITIDEGKAVFISSVASAVLLWIIFLMIIADLRVWYHNVTSMIRELDDMVSFHQRNKTLNESFLQNYRCLRGVEDGSLAVSNQKSHTNRRVSKDDEGVSYAASSDYGSVKNHRSFVIPVKPAAGSGIFNSPTHGQGTVNSSSRMVTMTIESYRESGSPTIKNRPMIDPIEEIA